MSREQLHAAGLSDSGIGRRVDGGLLHRLHRGVYAVGHRRLPDEGRWMAAVLACGQGAVLSHRSAAELWRLLRPEMGPIDVSIPTDWGRRQRQGIHVHRRPSLASLVSVGAGGRTTKRGNIPVTTPAQTIADLKGTVAAPQLRRTIREAEVLGLAVGAKQTPGGMAATRSELEGRFLALCRPYRLPRPEVNVRVGGYEVDFLWRREKVVVETDGYRYHRGAQAFEDDHERDLDLRSHGYDVHRFTYRQVTDRPQRIANALHQALAPEP